MAWGAEYSGGRLESVCLHHRASCIPEVRDALEEFPLTRSQCSPLDHHILDHLFRWCCLTIRIHCSRVLCKFTSLEVPVPEDAQTTCESSFEIFGRHADRKDSQQIHSRSGHTSSAFYELTRKFRYQNRGWGTPKLRAGRNRWNAQLFYLILGHHLGCTNFRTRGINPRLVLHQDRAALHPNIERPQTTGIDILISRLLRIRRIAERVTTHSSVRDGGKIPRIVLQEG